MQFLKICRSSNVFCVKRENCDIQDSISILEAIDPTFYSLSNFSQLSPLKDKINLNQFILALFYQLQTQKFDYYIDKSLVYKNSTWALLQLEYTRSRTSDAFIISTVDKIIANISNKKPVIQRDRWPGEQQLFKLIKLNSAINDIMPLKKLSSAIIKALHRHKSSINALQLGLVYEYISSELKMGCNVRKRHSENCEESLPKRKRFITNK